MNGIFAVDKPSGITSTQFLTKIQRIITQSDFFQKNLNAVLNLKIEQYKRDNKGKTPPNRILNRVSKIKMGHGGTLDPLASGVLVIGVGSGTKELANYLHGTVKCYEAEALLGISTTSGDCEPNGEIISVNSVEHLAVLSKNPQEKIQSMNDLSDKFKGHLKQTPPIFAALKMNGKPLHEYARQGIPLPRPIKAREVDIYDLKIVESDYLTTDHSYNFLKINGNSGKEEEKNIKDLDNLSNNSSNSTTQLYYSDEYCQRENIPLGEPIIMSSESKHSINDTENKEFQKIVELGDQYRAPMLHFVATVSSGTYIRSLIDDMGKALGSSAYMVSLKRISQKEWNLNNNNVLKLEDFLENDEKIWTNVLLKVLEKGASVDIRKEFAEEKENNTSTEKDLVEEKEEEEVKEPVEEEEEEEEEEKEEDQEPPTKKIKL